MEEYWSSCHVQPSHNVKLEVTTGENEVHGREDITLQLHQALELHDEEKNTAAEMKGAATTPNKKELFVTAARTTVHTRQLGADIVEQPALNGSTHTESFTVQHEEKEIHFLVQQEQRWRDVTSNTAAGVMVKKVVSVAAYSDCHCGVGLDGNMMKMEVRFERRRSLDGSSEASEARVVEEEMIPGSIRLPGWCMVGGNSDEPVVSVIMAQGGWVVWFVLRIVGCMDMDMLFQVLRPSPFCCCVTLVIPLPPSSAELFPPECDGVRENEEEGCMAVGLVMGDE
ncbi:hypothetical protein LR48_Vigan97s001000 [Vigna angularis]|uniref:Uncharacterized protein n=1 Tax=Phaseolus angularis TaxID=3914 RepID=A0A0L9T3Z1_PHAAN|nr:hypothetical protein LR48_Vigan97s001000 [Vigna angularis]